jgi:hypothetical protein
MIESGTDDDLVRVQWKDFGDWQRWVIEKQLPVLPLPVEGPDSATHSE